MTAAKKIEHDLLIAKHLIEAKRARADGIPGVSLEEFETSLRNAVTVDVNRDKQ